MNLSCDNCGRPKLLDAFCCQGGASKGYADAGFCVTGIDNVYQRRYPYRFLYGDAIRYIKHFGHQYAAIHASPPCQAFSSLGFINESLDRHVSLIEKTRDILNATGKPYVIENVVGAPLIDPIQLCGTQFPGLRVYRHRLFESNTPIPTLKHPRHLKGSLYTPDKRRKYLHHTNQDQSFVTITGGGSVTKANAQEAMGGLYWMTKQGCNQAIPPPYTEYIGRYLIESLL